MDESTYSPTRDDSDVSEPAESAVVSTLSVDDAGVPWEMSLERLSLMLNTFATDDGVWAVYDGIHILPMKPDEMLLRTRVVKRVMGWSLWASKDLPVGTCSRMGE